MEENTQEKPVAYSLNEAAKLIGIGKTRLYEEIGSKRLRAVKVGKRTLILSSDIQAWLSSLPVADMRSGQRTEV